MMNIGSGNHDNHDDKWANPYSPLKYQPLGQKGSKGHFDREQLYSWPMERHFKEAYFKQDSSIHIENSPKSHKLDPVQT